MWLAIVIVLPNVFFNDSEFYENKYSHLNNDKRVHDFSNEMFSYHMIKCAVLQNGVFISFQVCCQLDFIICHLSHDM